MKLKPVTNTGLAGVEGCLELGLALVVGHETEVNLLGDKLECAVNLILAPASHVAPHPCAICEDVIKLIVTRWQTRGVHIRVIEADVPVHSEEGDVVTEPGEGHGGVLEDPDHCVLLMTLLLRGIEATGVPLTNSHLQEVISGDVLELVGGSEHLPGGGVVVVTEVISDDSAGANKVIVLVEEDAGPGELSRRGLAMREAIDGASIGPGAASLSSIDRGLVTSLGPGLSILTSVMMLIQLLRGGIGADALVVALKGSKVKVWGIAACLVASRASVQSVELLRLGRRSVDNPGVNEALTHEVIHSGVEIKTVQICRDAAALILIGDLNAGSGRRAHAGSTGHSTTESLSL